MIDRLRIWAAICALRLLRGYVIVLKNSDGSTVVVRHQNRVGIAGLDDFVAAKHAEWRGA